MIIILIGWLSSCSFMYFNPYCCMYHSFYSINACFPPDIINYFSPDYPQTLLDRVEQFKPTLNIDPSMWTDRLFSDTKIPSEIKEEILALQKALMNGEQTNQAQEVTPPQMPPQMPPQQEEEMISNVESSMATVLGDQGSVGNGKKSQRGSLISGMTGGIADGSIKKKSLISQQMK